ncbi:hypothetical protein RUM43_003194 [Polyplax serrata]|uniref:Uncharacterized protein n=1 Tax=Polyplax serrata TaxID=468196 RepID=A0AAN8S5F2_POLSC
MDASNGQTDLVRKQSHRVVGRRGRITDGGLLRSPGFTKDFNGVEHLAIPAYDTVLREKDRQKWRRKHRTDEQLLGANRKKRALEQIAASRAG